MRFWDSSALIPLVCEEAISASCRRLLRNDRSVAVWALTRTEMVSAVRRREREGGLDRDETRSALRRIATLAEHWTEVDALAPVRERAERLLGLHPLASADALQLAAALALAQDRPRGRPFVTADDRLGRAAEAEGFEVAIPRA
ncbi:MAG: type II toxin-antitoxin system VapC family toxin [Planctomycetes bacterium]|nr:type II toxin-antitoxin system VapC family toxin [Planctomycetota bacterium]